MKPYGDGDDVPSMARSLHASAPQTRTAPGVIATALRNDAVDGDWDRDADGRLPAALVDRHSRPPKLVRQSACAALVAVASVVLLVWQPAMIRSGVSESTSIATTERLPSMASAIHAAGLSALFIQVADFAERTRKQWGRFDVTFDLGIGLRMAPELPVMPVGVEDRSVERRPDLVPAIEPVQKPKVRLRRGREPEKRSR